jgi:archaeosine synthase
VKFGILERDGLARIGSLEIDEINVRTPAIAFVDTERYPAPLGALKLKREWTGGKGDVVVASSSFSVEPRRSMSHALLHPGFRGSPYAEEHPSNDFALLRDPAGLLLDSEKFVAALAGMKGGQDLVRPTYCSVMGTPQRLAFLAYCGFDIFDSIPLIMSAENGWYLTTTGQLVYDKLEELPCSCPACSAGRRGKDELLHHNYLTAINELRLVKHSISEGTLRELVESRIRSEPWMVQNLRLLDLHQSDLLEMHAPIKGTRFHAGSKESLTRPDVLRWRKRLEQRYKRPEGARVLLLIPCSAKKPYSLSQSHMRFRQAIWDSGKANLVHEVIVTSPLGLVPRELELFYPAKDYDIPVTGHWDRDEKKMVEEMVSWLVESQKYDLVISHLGDEREPVNSVLKDFIDTSLGSPGSREGLRRLTDAIKAQAPDVQGPKRGTRDVDDMRSLCRFQFGEAGAELCENATVYGRWPNLKITTDRTQLGMLTGERGMVSLTLEGAAVLANRDSYCVEIEDFMPKGNLFVVGVKKAGKEIRIGDDVVVAHDKEARAVGVARMTPVEMDLAERGEAVHVRHALAMPI